MPRGGARPNSGGARPGAGRKPSAISEKRREFERLLHETSRDDFRAIIDQLIEAAKRGEPWAVKDVLDRVLGKPKQAVQFDGEVMQPLVVEIPAELWEPQAEDAVTVDGEARELPASDQEPVS